MQQEDILKNINVHDIKEICTNDSKRICYLISCTHCQKLHYKAQCEVIRGIRNNKRFFCTKACHSSYQETLQEVTCANCSLIFTKIPSQINKSKSGNHFCKKSCAATFNNKNKKYGTRRSKLELHIESQLRGHYPNLLFECNSKTTIGSELDFYFPTIKTAIQINGIVHFQPIYGVDKFVRITSLDNEKRIACQNKQIKLFELDCQHDTYLNKIRKLRKMESSKKYLGGSRSSRNPPQLRGHQFSRLRSFLMNSASMWRKK